MNQQGVDKKYILFSIIAVLFTWVMHEFAHWIMSESLGYKTAMFLNKTSFYKGENPTELDSVIISISGPFFTILQALVVFIFLKQKGWNKYAYPFLFTTLYMRVLAGFMNFINVNDEGRVGQFLGIGTFTLSILVCGLLFFMVYKISKMYSLGWKFQLGTYLTIMVISSILILADQFFAIRIL